MKWKLNKKLSRDCLSTFFPLFFSYKNPFALLKEASWLRYRHVLMWLAPWFLGEQQLGKAISNPSRQKGNAKSIESIQAFDITSQGPMGHASSTNFVFAFTSRQFYIGVNLKYPGSLDHIFLIDEVTQSQNWDTVLTPGVTAFYFFPASSFEKITDL